MRTHNLHPVTLLPFSACIFLVTALSAQTTSVPISEFLHNQGQSSSFFPPAGDYVGWVAVTCPSGGLSCWTHLPPGSSGNVCFGNFVLVDYAGLADRAITDNGGASSGTFEDGSVSERPVGDGSKVEVTVSLHTTNALTFVIAPTPPKGSNCPGGSDFDFSCGPVLLGARPFQQSCGVPSPPSNRR